MPPAAPAQGYNPFIQFTSAMHNINANNIERSNAATRAAAAPNDAQLQGVVLRLTSIGEILKTLVEQAKEVTKYLAQSFGSIMSLFSSR